MAYQIDRYNNSLLTVIEDGTLDQTTDLKFIGKNYAGYGEIQNENFLFLLENFAGANPPSKALTGQIWFDSASKKLKYNNGVTWKNCGSEVSATQPETSTEGDLWWNSDTNQLYSYTGSSYVLVGPQASGASSTKMQTISIIDETGVTRTAIASYVNEQLTAIFSGIGYELDAVNYPNENISDATFPRINKGITLSGAGLDGVSASKVAGTDANPDFIFAGTATDALKLGGVSADNFAQKDSATFTEQAHFYDPGLAVGDDRDLNIYIDVDGRNGVTNNNDAVIENNNGANSVIRFRATTSESTITDVFNVTALGIIPLANNTFSLGTSSLNFETVYAESFDGLATNAVTAESTPALNVSGTLYTASLSGGANTSPVRDSFGNITANKFLGTATNAEAVTIGSTRYKPSEITTPNSTAVRDDNGDITANEFKGNATTATNADLATSATTTPALKIGGTTYPASTSAIANTAVVRDGSGNINANIFNGTATAAQYADLAEKYTTNTEYPVGTAMTICKCFSHEAESASATNIAIGVISHEPAFLMNSHLDGQAIGLKGRVPVRVKGPIYKGMCVYTWKDGVCSAEESAGLVGIALESSSLEGETLIECYLKV